mmetsp:Transcript_22096/g.50529  ORF Transcript_22096/g.50529 Transcript_22096/m.50529 type:complete len:314 (-) Transcript_22096:385-1326(-)
MEPFKAGSSLDAGSACSASSSLRCANCSHGRAFADAEMERCDSRGAPSATMLWRCASGELRAPIRFTLSKELWGASSSPLVRSPGTSGVWVPNTSTPVTCLAEHTGVVTRGDLDAALEVASGEPENISSTKFSANTNASGDGVLCPSPEPLRPCEPRTRCGVTATKPLGAIAGKDGADSIRGVMLTFRGRSSMRMRHLSKSTIACCCLLVDACTVWCISASCANKFSSRRNAAVSSSCNFASRTALRSSWQSNSCSLTESCWGSPTIPFCNCPLRGVTSHGVTEEEFVLERRSLGKLSLPNVSASVVRPTLSA